MFLLNQSFLTHFSMPSFLSPEFKLWFIALRTHAAQISYGACVWLLRVVGARLFRWLRWLTWAGLALASLSLVALIVLRYTIPPEIDRYRVDIERAASRATGLQVRVAGVAADWHGLRPGLILKQVEVFDRNQRLAFKLPEISARLSWRSLMALEVRLAYLGISGVDLDIHRDTQGHITVAGIAVNTASSDDRVAQWMLLQSRIVVRNARVRWTDALRGLRDPDKPAPELLLENLNFVLENGGRHHRFGLQATPPAALAERFDVRGDFSHGVLAQRIADYTQWDGTLYLNLVVHDLTAGKRYIDYPLAVDRGRGALRAWLDFDAMTLRRFTADVSFDQVVTRLRRDLALLGLQHVRGRLKLSYDKNAYQVELNQFELQTAEGLYLKSLDLRHRFEPPSAHQIEHGELAINELDLQTLANLAGHLPLPQTLHKLLRSYDPRGVLTQVKAEWSGTLLGALNTQMPAQMPNTNGGTASVTTGTAASTTAAPEKNTPLTYQVHADFHGLSSRAQPATAQENGHAGVGLPGFSNLSGHIDGNQGGGALTLDSTQASLIFPGVFEEPELMLASLAGKINWKHKAGVHDIKVERLEFANEDAAGALNGTYRYDGRGPGVADLNGKLTRGNALRISRYLPLGTPEARAWVSHAVQGGNSDDVQFTLRGDLREFPFVDPKQGQFRIAIKVKEGTLAYLPGWPALEKVTGELVFERQGLHGVATSARIYDVAIGKTRFAIDDLRHNEILTLEGSAQGPLQDVVRYVNNSPISEWSERFTESTTADGPSKLEVKLEMPLLESEKAKVTSSLRFYGNNITLERGMPMMTRAQGQLIYDQHGLSVRNVSANFIGGLLRLEGQPNAAGETAIRVDGTMTAQGLQHAYPSLLTKRISGSSRYSGRITLRKRVPEVQIDSTLTGLAINLPAPLHKRAGETWPLHIEKLSQIAESVTQQKLESKSENTTAGKEEFRMTLGREIRLRLQRERDAKGDLLIKRGVLSVNENSVLPESGFAANINLHNFNLDEWRPLFSGSGAGDTAGGVAFDAFTLRSHEIQAYGKKMQNVTLGASRIGNAWQANVDADQLSGYFSWRPGETGAVAGKLTARLARLEIPQSAAGEVSTLLTDAPDDIPALDIIAEDFTLLGQRFGQLELVAINTGTAANHVWRMQRLNISNPDATFSATGSWGREPFSNGTTRGANAGVRKTALNFTLDLHNAGKLLDRFGKKEMIKNGTGKLEGEISWRGVPFTIDYASLNGKMQLAIDKGQFLKADPGIAKLLGVLSLQALPRRITLDFRDVFSDGFAFDTVRSNFDLNSGIAVIKDFKMKGVAATVLMEGSVDLARETQKLHLVVLPEISGGVATLAWSLLANPAIGVASFLAQLVLKDPIAKAFSHEYDVTGSWAEPNVVKVERNPVAQETMEGNRP